MRRSPAFLRTLLTALIVLTAVSASQAGLFGRWRDRYDYYPSSQGCPPVTVPTPSASGTAASGQPVVATAGPMTYTVAKPVSGENAPAAVAPVPATGSYVPAPSVYRGGGWSTIPRSSWDIGRFPPYSN